MRDTMEETSRTRLIKATLSLMGERQGRDIPTREILKKAGMANMSAVSYHFGSKEKLVREALRWYYDGMSELISGHSRSQAQGADLLMALAEDLLAFISQNPGLEKTMLTRMIQAHAPDPDFTDALRKNYSLLADIVSRAACIDDPEEAGHRVVIFMSGIVYPFLLGQYGPGVMDLSADPGPRYRAYLQSLVDAVIRK